MELILLENVEIKHTNEFEYEELIFFFFYKYLY